MKEHKIQEGLRHTVVKLVTKEDLASTVGTSKKESLSTTALVLFIERTISSLIEPYLMEDEASVTSEINVKHFRPAHIHESVRCIVHLKFVEGHKLFFDVAVFNEQHNEIAIGAHSRSIVKLNEDIKP
ncbi:MAG TPA: hotdog domain-containing protein [Marinilabiliaceae bacterium]|nr:hotdog domain-containing protein [Marinilabiliaceae bacterium]